MNDPILTGAQQQIDADQPGYVVTSYTAVVEIQRLNSNGTIESGLALYTPAGQPDHITEILLSRGDRLRESKDVG